jgi:hypothetical protein
MLRRLASPLLVPSLALGTFLAALAPAAHAQDAMVHAADSLLRAGQVFRAETLYYVAVRRDPRSPEARLALGRYLAARGASKIGATLLEEARFFGGDPAQVARELAPVYARMGDWRALAQLPSSPLNAAERQRAEWLRASPPSHLGPDSAVVPYVADGEGLGRIAIRIGSDSIDAVIDPSVRGLVLDSAWMRRPGVKVFGSSNARTIGVVPAVRMGTLALTNVSVAFGATGGARRARIGLDVLGDFMPTFDGGSRRLVLRRGGRAPMGGVRVATLALPTGVWLVRDGGVVPLASETGRAVTGVAPWTLVARRGEIVVGR